MSLDLTVDASETEASAAVPAETIEVASGQRQWLYDAIVAGAAVFCTVLASAASVLLYLR